MPLSLSFASEAVRLRTSCVTLVILDNFIPYQIMCLWILESDGTSAISLGNIRLVGHAKKSLWGLASLVLQA